MPQIGAGALRLELGPQNGVGPQIGVWTPCWNWDYQIRTGALKLELVPQLGTEANTFELGPHFGARPPYDGTGVPKLEKVPSNCSWLS